MTQELRASDFDHIEVDPGCGLLGCLLLITEFELENWPKTHDSVSGHVSLKAGVKVKPKRKLIEEDDDGQWGMKPKRKLKEEDDDGEWGMKPKPKRSKKLQPQPPMPTPDLPDNFKRRILENMGASDLGLVIQKALYFSDVNPTASRFSAPFSQVKTHDFLTGAEARSLAAKNPMEVRFLEPSMKETTLTFNRWEMSKNKLYVWTKAWNSVVKGNRLQQGDTVQLWSFRVNSELCFALVKVDVQAGN